MLANASKSSQAIQLQAAIAESPSVSRRYGRFLRWGLAGLFLTYPAIALLMWIFQDHFIFPGHDSQGTRWTDFSLVANQELIPLKTSRGDLIKVLFQRAPDPMGKPIRASAVSPPTILFFYGGGGSLAGSINLLSHWRELGANVAAVEYPGYGVSGGLPSEAGFYSAGDAAYDCLVQRPEVDRTKIIVAGQSLGTGVAVDLAARKSVGALVLFSPYTSMIAMAHVEYPWLPTSRMVHTFFRSDEKIGAVKTPILIVHGEHDRTVPIQMSRDLAAKCKANVTTLFVDADHNDLFDRASAQIDAAMLNLMNSLKRQ